MVAEDFVHIVLYDTKEDGSIEEVFGHLMFKSYPIENNGSGVILSLIVFNKLKERKQFGSIMLTIMDEWLGIKYEQHDIIVTLQKDVSINIVKARKFFRSLYFNDVLDKDYLKNDNLNQIIIEWNDPSDRLEMICKNVILLRSTIPISIASCIFFWLYPKLENNNYFEIYCRHMMSCLLNGWDNRRLFLNVVMSNVRFILEDVFPVIFSEDKSHFTCENVINSKRPLLKKGDGVNDHTLSLLVKHVRTLPAQVTCNSYVPGLLTVDLGYRIKDINNEENDLYNDEHDDKNVMNLNYGYLFLTGNYEENIYYKNRDKQGHCVFLTQLRLFFQT